MEKKQEILQAANECFLQYGYSKTSMSDIGRRVNLNKASLYYHFKDKISLYTEVIGMHRAEHLASLEPRLDSQQSAAVKILLFMEEEIHFSQKTSVILTVGNNATLDTKNETKQVYLAIVKEDIMILSKMIQEGINQQEFMNCDANKIATIILKITDAMLNLDCPLHLDEIQRDIVYTQVKIDLKSIIGLILNGITLTK